MTLATDEKERRDEAKAQVSEQGDDKDDDEGHYKLWSMEDISEQVVKWSQHYGDLVQTFTAQDAFGLQTAGNASDCAFLHKDDDDDDDGDATTVNTYKDGGCPNYFMVIQDYNRHPLGSDTSNTLPEVLWSGALHGDERVGPTAVMEATQLLLDATMCEALPRIALKPSPQNPVSPIIWQREMEKARACRQELLDNFGITKQDRQWLARLVSTRRIVVVPTANALGYDRNHREEEEIDPNRDFPYDVEDPTQCMQTIAARTLNEIFRKHLFQLALTFHGGMEVIGYEWGAESYMNYTSPDDDAQNQIAAAYSYYGGGWPQKAPYKFGSMNDFVYPVRGGMEDWAYAGSWDTERVMQCQPITHGGYPAERTTYDAGTLRTFNMLVETSDSKTPDESTLGSSSHVLHLDHPETNGHVARNVRVAFLAAELVEPYVVYEAVNELELSEDVVPMLETPKSALPGLASCPSLRAVRVPMNSGKTVVRWHVGGALTVDETNLYFAAWDDLKDDSHSFGCFQPENPNALLEKMTQGTPIGPTSGTARFHSSGIPSSAFAASIDIRPFAKAHQQQQDAAIKQATSLIVMVTARVDQSWKTQSTPPTSNDDTNLGIWPPVPPQSHMVNARTNPEWQYQTPDGKSRVQGRLDWFSFPLLIELGNTADDSDNNNDNVDVETIEISRRWNRSEEEAPTGSAIPPPPLPAAAGSSSSTSASSWTPVQMFGTVFGVCVLVMALWFFRRRCCGMGLRNTKRHRVRQFIQDESAISPGLQFKEQESGNHHVGVVNGRHAGGFSDVPQEEEEDGPAVEMRQYSKR